MSTAGPNPPHSAPTLSAVAKLAGVSSITVSRVVRLPDMVAPETRGRVEAAMTASRGAVRIPLPDRSTASTRLVEVAEPTSVL